MRCRIEREPLTNFVNVWLYTEGETGAYVWRPSAGPLALEKVEPGVATVEPSLRLSDEVLEALVREAQGFVSASDATTRHLDDAVAVRDRLMVLIERGWSA